MTIPLEFAIVRICAANNVVIGTGFLVTDRHIITCAHVVTSALDLPHDTPDPPRASLYLDFPLLAPDEILTARVTHWQPTTDVAGLELISVPPSRSKPVRLIATGDFWGHSFRAFGFPAGYDQGVWASGILRGPQADGWLQIEDTKETGYFIAPGFSGGPVWDNVLGGVIGMIVAADTAEGIKAAFLIPTDVLVETWPDLVHDYCKSTALDAPIEPPYGTMSPDSRFYIERQADNDCWNYLDQGHAVTIYVQAPRQMGKSSLMRRIAHRVSQVQGVATAFIDFEKFTEQQLADEKEFLVELCYMISDALHIPEKIDKYWGGRRRSNLIKCSNYLSRYIIPTFGKSFILAMDEVERLLTTPWRNDFFGMLRTWHNDRAWDADLAKMTLFLSSSTEPYLFIDNLNQSPFNVVEPISLGDLALSEVQELNRRYGVPLDDDQVYALVELLDGHPFLSQLSLYMLSTHKVAFKTLIETASFDNGPFGNHIRRYWRLLLEMPEIRQSLFQIIQRKSHIEDKIFYRLKGAGLIKKVGKQVVMRNELYARYFKERLDE